MLLSDQVIEIFKVGHFIDECQNWALTKEQALNAIDQLEKIGIAILGGDVYERVKGDFIGSWDSWYSNIEEGESETSYIKRSVAASRSYINKFNYRISTYFIESSKRTGVIPEIFFVIIPDIKNT